MASDEPHDEQQVPTPDLPPWMQTDDEWEEAPARTRPERGRLLAIAAAVPWLLALVLVMRSGDGGPTVAASTGLTTGSETGATAAPSPSADADRLGHPRVSTTPPPAADANRPRVTVTEADAVAMATAVARAWLTGVGPRLPIDGVGEPAPQYAEHLVAEAIDHPSPGFAVVTLLAVVLDVDGEAYRGATVRRLAVPVALDAAGAHPAGTPWWLPGPDLSPTVVERTVLDDPDLQLEAAEAAQAAGYRDVELLELSATDSWPLIATLRAIAPGQTEASEHELWVRPHLKGLVVAGWLPPLPDAPTDASPEERP